MDRRADRPRNGPFPPRSEDWFLRSPMGPPLVILALVGIAVFVVIAFAEARNLSRGPRRPAPLVRMLVVVFLAWRLATWLLN